jgi:hypothetical protein
MNSPPVRRRRRIPLLAWCILAAFLAIVIAWIGLLFWAAEKVA